MTADQTQRQPPRESEVADKAYHLWVRIEALSSWLMEHYWYVICDRLEAGQCMDEWPPELGSEPPSSAP